MAGSRASLGDIASVADAEARLRGQVVTPLRRDGGFANYAALKDAVSAIMRDGQRAMTRMVQSGSMSGPQQQQAKRLATRQADVRVGIDFGVGAYSCVRGGSTVRLECGGLEGAEALRAHAEGWSTEDAVSEQFKKDSKLLPVCRYVTSTRSRCTVARGR